MSFPETSNSSHSDVLHSKGHFQMTAEQIAKAVARHQREHPNQAAHGVQQPLKTAPRN